MSAELGYTKILKDTTFDQALERTTKALGDHGFGLITEIDFSGKMKEKIDVDMRPYRILGACNPKYAHAAVSQNPAIGLLLPCNVTVAEQDSGDIAVSFIRPLEMFKVLDDPGMESFVAEVDQAIRGAYEAL
jgi:uncharacterized protein (DUF302 family)